MHVKETLRNAAIEEGLWEDAVKWRVLDQTMAEARTGFADLPPDAVEALADEAVAAECQANKAAAS